MEFLYTIIVIQNRHSCHVRSINDIIGIGCCDSNCEGFTVFLCLITIDADRGQNRHPGSVEWLRVLSMVHHSETESHLCLYNYSYEL